MSKIKHDNFITIQGWMVTDLQLKGNDLIVYAIIYGFSQDDGSVFNGSLQYLADWCNSTKQGVQKNLKNLIDKKLIEKKTETINGLTLCTYWCTDNHATELHGEQQSCMGYTTELHGGIQLSCMNNIEDNINKYNLSKDKLPDEKSEYESHMYSKEDFLGSNKKTAKPKRKSLFSQCTDEINSYTMFHRDNQLAELLTQYLTLRLEMKDKPIYGVNQWKGLLNKLTTIVSENKNMSYSDVVKQSIERGYASFFPVNSSSFYAKKDVFAEGSGLSCEQSNDTAEERKAKLEESGRRGEF